MSEKLGIYGSLRNGTTVYSEILTVLTTAVLMDYTGYVLLSHTALSGNQDRDICWSNGNGNLQRPVERRIISDDVKFIL